MSVGGRQQFNIPQLQVYARWIAKLIFTIVLSSWDFGESPFTYKNKKQNKKRQEELLPNSNVRWISFDWIYDWYIVSWRIGKTAKWSEETKNSLDFDYGDYFLCFHVNENEIFRIFQFLCVDSKTRFTKTMFLFHSLHILCFVVFFFQASKRQLVFSI